MGVVRMIEYQGKTYRFTELCEKLQIRYPTDPAAVEDDLDWLEPQYGGGA